MIDQAGNSGASVQRGAGLRAMTASVRGGPGVIGLDEIGDRHAVIGIGIVQPRRDTGPGGNSETGMLTRRIAESIAAAFQPQHIIRRADPQAENVRARRPDRDGDGGLYRLGGKALRQGAVHCGFFSGRDPVCFHRPAIRANPPPRHS